MENPANCQGIRGRNTVRQYVRAIEPATKPDDLVQAVLESGARLVQTDGKKTKTWIFRAVLSHSRKGYTEAVLRQNTETFLRCLENAFHHLGGVSLTCQPRQPEWIARLSRFAPGSKACSGIVHQYSGRTQIRSSAWT
jgi:hypothetical protein